MSIRFLPLLLWLPTFPAAAGDFAVGAAARSIMPNPLLPVSGGLGPSNPVTESRGELSARAIVCKKNGVKLALVTVDVLGFPGVLCDRARDRISHIPRSNILVGASHTHSAPDCYAFPDGKGGHTGNLEYMDFVARQIANAVNDAHDRMRPARIRIGTREAKGKIAYNYYAPDLYDRRVSVIQALDATDSVIATLVNYAVHPEVLGAEAGICSPDLVGPLRDRIESTVGGLALFMNGALGGMVTADNRNLDEPRDPMRGYWNDSRTWNECQRIGRELADESIKAVQQADVQEAPQLRCHVRSVDFPVESDAMWAIVQGSPLKYPHNAAQRTITTTINLIELGNAKILTIPGEALPNIGFYLKRKMGAQHNLLFGLTNDAFGYIMTKVDYQSFPRYDYVSRTSLGEQTGEILIRNALQLLDHSPSRPTAAE